MAGDFAERVGPLLHSNLEEGETLLQSALGGG
jgi:hypothetical protein